MNSVSESKKGLGGAMAKLLARLSNGVDAVVRPFMQLSLLAIVLLVLLEVFLRNVVGQSLYWIEEVAVTYIGTWFVFVGASHTMKVGALIRLEFLVDKLRARVATTVFIISQLIVLLFLVVIVTYGIRLTAMTLEQPSPALQLPIGIAYFGIVMGCSLMILHTAAFIFARFGGRRAG